MKISRYVFFPIVFLLLISLISVNIYLNNPPNSSDHLFLSTTTSVRDSGLLDYLISKFEEGSSLDVSYTAVGSGAAIQLARDGEVDAVLVHAPNLEQGLVDDGYSLNKTTLWYNYFIVVGPSSDPANIKTAANVSEVFQRIQQAGKAGNAVFYSRGDESGTHQKEKAIWSSINYQPDPNSEWYEETGSGMSATLVLADNDPNGYTLTDLGTFATLTNNDKTIELQQLYGGDALLYNPYSYHIIDKNKTGTDLNTQAAYTFLHFLTLESTNQLVRDFTVGNIILFTPIGD